MRRSGNIALACIVLAVMVLLGQTAAPKAPKGCQAYMEWAQQQHYAEDLKTAQWRAGNAAMAPHHNGKLPTGTLYYVLETTGKGQGDLVPLVMADDVMIDLTNAVRPVVRTRPKK